MARSQSLGGRLVREPLVQFLAVGAALFAIQSSAGAGSEDRPAAPDTRLIVAASTVEGIARDQAARTGRAPGDAELRDLTDRWVDDEVLYREALRLGLDKGDPIVRRRLVQKMQFLSQDLAQVAEPTDAELEAWLAARPEVRTPGRVTFEHLFFSRDRRGEVAREDAAVVLLALQDGTRVEGKGDPFVHGKRAVARSEADLAAQYGASFARAALEAPEGAWSGPLESSFGWHVVRVTERSDERAATLEEVRGRVRRELVEERRAKANRQTVEKLRGQWEVVVEAPASGAKP